jgi:hypothetical protein
MGPDLIPGSLRHGVSDARGSGMRSPTRSFTINVFPTGETPQLDDVGPTTCFHILGVIQVYADGECDVSIALAVASHLDTCPHCRAELASLRWLKSAVRRCHGRPESRPCL